MSNLLKSTDSAFRWKKHGVIYNPVLDQHRPSWSYQFAQGQNVLIFDEFVRVYFCTRQKPDENGKTVSRVSYLDLDRMDLKHILHVAQEPCLTLGGTGAFDEFGTYPFSPIRVGDQIYGYYGGVARGESVPFYVSIGMAVSDRSGEKFKKTGTGPVLSASLHEPFVICSPKVRCFNGRYYMYYSAGQEWTLEDGKPEMCYQLRLAISTDGITWARQNLKLIPPKLSALESQASGDVIQANGKYHMFYCYRNHTDFRRNRENAYRLGYAWSEDLLHWQRDDEKIGLFPSDCPDDPDSEMVAYPNVFELDGKIYMLYLGNEVGKLGFLLAELEGELM